MGGTSKILTLQLFHQSEPVYPDICNPEKCQQLAYLDKEIERITDDIRI